MLSPVLGTSCPPAGSHSGQTNTGASLTMAAVLSPPPHPYATSSSSAPPTSRPASSESWKSHAVNRSSELLSCARTALKIGQSKFRQRQRPQENGGRLDARSEDSFPEWLADVNPAELQLYQPPINSFYNQQQQSSGNSHWNCSTQQLLRDTSSLLSHLDAQLSSLHSLVRRRGHTNDPTLEIQSLLSKFQEGAQELSEICTSLRKAGALPYTVDNAAADAGATSRYELDNPYIGKKSSMQRRRHYELLASQVEMEGKERMDKLKKELEMRSVVLREQVSHRKKFLAASGGGGCANATGSAGVAGGVGGVGGATRPMLPSHNKNVVSKNASNQFRSPLFTMTASGNMPSSNTSSLTTTTSSAPSSVSNGPLAASATRTSRPPPASASITSSGYSSYGGYGGSSSYAGYGGASNSANNNNTQQPSFSTGMRQRKQQPQKSTIQIDNGADDKYNKSTDGESSDIQQQIQTRRQNRQTQSRLASARLAEKSIAELGTMFTKMSTLISQQGEMLERIEDDVEAAGGDIDAGHEELVKVYGMTKGNRALILKVFGILIGLIIFMKLY